MARLSESGAQFLKRHEGCINPSKLAFKEEKYYTVGYGHYGADVRPNSRYSDEEIKQLFIKDIAKFENDVNKIYSEAKGMTQNMFDAMVSFAYNHGNISSTQLGSTIASNPKDFNQIQRVWETSYINKGKSSEKGLRNRRKDEAQLYCGEQYVSQAYADSTDSTDESTGGESQVQIEQNILQDVSSGVNSEDYDEVNSNSFEVRIDDGWEHYDTFTIQQDDTTRTLGQTALAINDETHGKADDPDEHKLIEDETVQPSIKQDEHSAPIKEDTDTREEDKSINVDEEKIGWSISDIPHGGAFAI